jgi:hypothetical protein
MFKHLKLPKVNLNLESIKKYLGFHHPDKPYCMSRVGKAGDVKRRGDRYLTMRQDAEFDIHWLTHEYLNDNQHLNDRERKIAFQCHKRLLDFYKKCREESLGSIIPEKKKEKEFIPRPRSD